MGDDLVYIETLDDLANAIKLACQQLDGPASGKDVSLPFARGASFRSGLLSLGDVAKDDYDEESEEERSKRQLRALLLAWQALVEELFTQKAFLKYAPSLESCISQLSDLEQADLKRLKDLVQLMTHTVQNHALHECTELRYGTLLEVVLSYNADWKPSPRINELWEELELQVESDCEAEDFRRVAYKVLVQLPWLPQSSGLFLACGHDVTETMSEELPDHVRCQFDQIYATPILRADKVHQILESLQEDEAFTITITYTPPEGTFNASNGEGIGKTTLAALLASHPTITQNFDILWVTLDDSKPLDSEKYTRCLDALCRQIKVKPTWPDRILRLEDMPARAIRDFERMNRAKDCITKLLEGSEQNIMIVLDGIHDEKDFAWFHFLESQSSIVVSKSHNIPGTTYTVEMEGLGESEALELFAIESSNDPDHPIFHTVEAKSLMELCAYHPLIIRTASHWFKMKQVTSGLSKGLEELLLELSVLRNNKAVAGDSFKILSEVMNLMLSPQQQQRNGSSRSKVLKLCLASTSVVFGLNRVPLDSVLALWSQVITTDEESVAEIGEDPTGSPNEFSKKVWFIAEAFIHLGLLSFSEEEEVIFVQLHHDLYVKYGNSIIPELTAMSAEEAMTSWHNSFVAGYNARLRTIQDSEGMLQDSARPYVLRHIVKHMIQAKTIPKVLEMLKDDRSCRERLAKFGWIEGARMQVEDCQLLASKALESKSATEAETQKVVLACLKRMSAILSEEPDLADETRVEKAMALHLIGFTQAENLGLNEALTSYKNAMQLMPLPSHHFNGIIMYSQAVIHLIRNDYDKSLKKLKACAKFLKDHAAEENSPLNDLHAEIAQLRGDAQAGTCDYVSAETSYEEALALVERASKADIGTVLLRRARIHQTMGELDQALAALTECVNWKLDNAERTSRSLAQSYSVAGDIYIEFNEDEKAVRQYMSALETLADLEVGDIDLDYLLLKAKLALLSGSDDESKELFGIFQTKTMDAPRLFLDQSAYELRITGKMFMTREDFATAKIFLEGGVDLTMDRPDSLERASILSELGECLFHLEQHSDAAICLEEAVKIRKAKLGQCELLLDSQITLGNMYKKLSMNPERLAVSKEVMFLTEKIYKGDEGKAASALFGVAEAYEVLGQNEEAISMFQECKELLKRALPKDHIDVAKVMQSLATIYELMGNFDSAYENNARALDIAKANFESDDPQLGEIYHRLGITCRKMQEYDKTRNHLQEALTIFKSNEMARETCLVLMALGDVYRLLRDPDTAMMCYERCFTFAHDTKEDPDLMGSLYLGFGHARLSKKLWAGAQECFEKALRNRTERFGKDHESTAKASRSLGIVKYMTNSFAEARIYMEDFVRVMEAKKTVNDIPYVLVLELLGEINLTEGRKAEAKVYWTKAKNMVDEFPTIHEKAPTLEDIITHRMQKAQTQGHQTKSFFSRFTELARFEDEVSAELPVEERLADLITTLVFIDD